MKLYGHFNWSYGSCGLRVGKIYMMIKAPWNLPLFTERNGLKRWVPLGFGWRFRLYRWEGRG